MDICIYARVSTRGQSLESQIEACKRFCDYKGYEIGHVYAEKVSGIKAKRPEYGAMLAALREHTFGGVVAFKLDRLGRNSRELILTIEELESKGIKVLSVTENFDTTMAIGRAMREIICIMAALERENISESTALRLAAVKASGKRLGRKPGSKDKQPRQRSGYWLRYANKRGS